MEYVKDCDGWLFDSEADLLRKYNLLRPFKDSTCWCEIGSWKGLSTKVLCEIEKGFAIDWFRGSDEHEPNTFTYPEFYNRLKHEIADGIVTVLPTDSYRAYPWVTSPISLLFIDGDHSYEGCRRDFDLYQQKVIKNGYIILHDAWHERGQENNTPWPGVTQVAKELRNDSSFIEVQKVDRCAVFRKVAQIQNPLFIENGIESLKSYKSKWYTHQVFFKDPH